jgi:hypothetical protein
MRKPDHRDINDTCIAYRCGECRAIALLYPHTCSVHLMTFNEPHSDCVPALTWQTLHDETRHAEWDRVALLLTHSDVGSLRGRLLAG